MVIKKEIGNVAKTVNAMCQNANEIEVGNIAKTANIMCQNAN